MALRVIAGSAGGIPLVSPRSIHVRPTMEQVRGAIFSSLAERVPEARVLDLFAGVGSLGIEALSRGAARVTFVERDRSAVACIHANLEKTRLGEGADTVCLDVFAFLKRTSPGTPFDLILADPPYTTADQPTDFAAQLLDSTELRKHLAPDGIFVLEKSPLHRLPEVPAAWQVIRQKRYGTTEVLFLQHAEPNP